MNGTADLFARSAEDSYATFESVKAWKKATGRPVLGYFPVYFPSEIAHAMGFLPVSLLGASGRVGLDMATAHTQSFVCSISRSVFQLSLQGNLDVMDVLLFSNICDVARNLSGITKRNLGDRRIEYLHYPINNTSAHAVPYLREEYRRLADILAGVTHHPLEPEALRRSMELYNRKRALQEQLTAFRRARPGLLPYTEYYNVLRAGGMLPVEEYLPALESYLAELPSREGKPKDGVKVMVLGNFCEQPPVMLMKSIEDAGCFILHDEALVGERWLGQSDLTAADPLESLARGYVQNLEPMTVRFHPSVNKQKALLDRARTQGVEGVVFATPKFCEPALYDYMIGKPALEKANLPYLHIEYEESASSFEHARTMVETFTESILFD